MCGTIFISTIRKLGEIKGKTKIVAMFHIIVPSISQIMLFGRLEFKENNKKRKSYIEGYILFISTSN